MQVIYINMWGNMGWFSFQVPPFPSELKISTKSKKNTQQHPKLLLTGTNQASQRSMGEVWLTVFVPSNRLHTAVQDEVQKTYTAKPEDSMCANTRRTSTNIHKLIVHVHACCPLEIIPSQFLNYEITSTWHEVMSLYCPKQQWKNAENAYIHTFRA